MALHITNIDQLKKSKLAIENAKQSYSEHLDILKNAVIEIRDCWQGEDSLEFQNKLIEIIKDNLALELSEMDFEVRYLNKITTVLENAQDQVKKRLNE